MNYIDEQGISSDVQGRLAEYRNTLEALKKRYAKGCTGWLLRPSLREGDKLALLSMWAGISDLDRADREILYCGDAKRLRKEILDFCRPFRKKRHGAHPLYIT